ncbi:hypothetical protein ID866_10689 [Astraeus odoratus]|nr:hypothetical protein ID866_10689 [Astraeus odoratus]
MYGGSSLCDYTAGLHAWHLLHGILWNINNEELHSILKGVAGLTPQSSEYPKRPPCEMDTSSNFLHIVG